jgi:hypothetical protein
MREKQETPAHPDRERADRDPEEEGSAAKRPQRDTGRENDPEEEGSAGRPER